MHTDAPRLIDRLRTAADLWAEQNGATLARLGRLVLNDSSFFNRIESPQGTTTATLERFARFLGDVANWPDSAVPPAVREFVHVVGVSPESSSPSPDTSPADIAAGAPDPEERPSNGPSCRSPAAARPDPVDAAAGGLVFPEAAR